MCNVFCRFIKPRYLSFKQVNTDILSLIGVNFISLLIFISTCKSKINAGRDDSELTQLSRARKKLHNNLDLRNKLTKSDELTLFRPSATI